MKRRDQGTFWLKSCSRISRGSNSFHSGVDKMYLLIKDIVGDLNTDVIYHK